MIHFTKMHGLGNDFVIIDAINQKVELSPEQIRLLGDRHFGVGFDQLLLVEKPKSKGSEFTYRIFNADGSEAAQCGNGARCFAHFVKDKGLTENKEIQVDTNAGQLILKLLDNRNVQVNMGIPKHAPDDVPMYAEKEAKSYSVDIFDKTVDFGAVSLGNPHAVIQVEDISRAPVTDLGQVLENNPLFPERANIGFMQVIDRNRIKLRVFERGAGETLACGSGASAAVVIGIEQGLLDKQAVVELNGGNLSVSWAGRGKPVFMEGPTATIYEGNLELAALGEGNRHE